MINLEIKQSGLHFKISMQLEDPLKLCSIPSSQAPTWAFWIKNWQYPPKPLIFSLKDWHYQPKMSLILQSEIINVYFTSSLNSFRYTAIRMAWHGIHIYAFPFSFVQCLLTLQIFNILLCIEIFSNCSNAHCSLCSQIQTKENFSV